MGSLCIISCSSKKIWDKNPELDSVKAQNAYISPFFKKCKAYADKFYEDWIILSAKYGFLYPNDIIPATYDVTFNSLNSEVISISELKEQINNKKLNQFEDIVVLGGAKYREIVKEAFEAEHNYIFSLKDCGGIGYMLQKLNYALENEKKISN